MVAFKKKNINKKWLFSLGVIFLGCFLVGDFCLAQSDVVETLKSGSGEGGFFSNTLLTGVNAILYGFFKLALMLLAGSMWLLDTMISPEMFSGVFFSPVAKEGINTAWSFVRDFFNLFFILIIVLVGLSTILGVSKFKDKTVLMRVIIAAMLINFSKPLTLFVIDISQVFMHFFANAIQQMAFTAQLQNLISFDDILSPGNLGDKFAYFVILIVVILMTIIMAIMLFYLAISLIVRMISFWVLIILSPLAMFGFAMEGTKLGSMKDDWVKNLMSWCFYGPILLFFFWLAIILLDALVGATKAGIDPFSSMNPEQIKAGSGALSSFAVKLFSMLIPYITVIYLLFYGYDQAKKTSSDMATKILGAGSAKISAWGNKTGRAAKKFGYGAASVATFKKQREAVKEGIKHGVKNYDGKGSFVTKRLTKSGRDDLQAQRVANAKKKYGRDGGAATRSYERGKAQEKLKKWKDDPITDVEMDKLFEKGDLAATLYKSQNNKLGVDASGNNQYEKAMENLKDDKAAQEQITRETKRENLGAFIDYKKHQKIQEKIKEGNNSFDGLKRGSKEYHKASAMAGVDKEIFNKNIQGNLGSIIKNQNKSFYEQPGVVEYLFEKNQNTKINERRKFAENIKNIEARDFLIAEKTGKGKFLLGEDENNSDSKTTPESKKIKAGFLASQKDTTNLNQKTTPKAQKKKTGFI